MSGAPPGAGQHEGPPDDLVQQFRREGYCVVRDLYTRAEVETLRSEMLAICRGERGAFQGQDRDQSTGHRIAAGVPHDDAALYRYYCIHFPHKLSRTFLSFMAEHGPTNALLARLVGPNVKAVQSMAFVKSPGMPGQPWHQDEQYIPTHDRSLVGSWIALDDATLANGTLQVWPGSHSRGELFPTGPHGRADGFYDAQSLAYGHGYSDAAAVPVELPAGGCIFLSGYLLHRSTPNRPDSGSFRRVLSCHYMSCESPLPWPKDGSVEDNRDVVICTGTDPHAHKGFEDRHAPFLRPLPETWSCWTPLPAAGRPDGGTGYYQHTGGKVGGCSWEPID